jgi:quercetin dioxygenase-like cupin family protein
MSISKVSLVVVSIFFLAATICAQEMTPSAGNVNEQKLAPVPGLAACALGAVQSGDPTKGASIFFSKMAAGCSIPWHWHTPTEHIMMVSGVALLEMKEGKPITLRSGGFAKLPSRHIHQFRCQQDCQLFVYSDVAFDIHYVDAQGKEIPAADALKTATGKAGPK